MSYTISPQRNPNLSIPQSDQHSPNLVQKKYGDSWWTGLTPTACPGFSSKDNCLHALPLLNLDICTRQDVLDYFNNTWTLTELLFSGLKTEDAFYRPPYHELRHPLIFYYGHTAVLYYNKLRLAGLLNGPLDLYLEKILETGVDEMSWDDMAKNQMQWPDIETVKMYKRKVYETVLDIISNHPALSPEADRELKGHSPLWALFMGFEHEKIHFETTSVLIRELPITLVETPPFWMPMHGSSGFSRPTMPVKDVDYPANNWIEMQGKTVTWGKPLNAPSFGWDNEYGSRTTTIREFKVTENLVSNGEYYEFVSNGSYVKDEYWSEEGLAWRKFRNSKRPTFWVSHGPEGLHDYKLRTIFEVIDMPWSWPVEVNFHEAQAFCRWRQEKDNSALCYRLITEPEHVALRPLSLEDPVLQKGSYQSYSEAGNRFDFNLNFSHSSPTPVDLFPKNSNGVRDLFGNLWQWAEDQFNPLDGFEVHYLYDDFSTPCFDGKHQMILGGSFISCGHEASKWARFHFRPHFFQHAGFRIAATLDGSDDNGSTRLQARKSYIHVTRQNSLDQMQNGDWWKTVHQPLEFSGMELDDLWEATRDHITRYESERDLRSPIGSALDPRTNDLRQEFRVPYLSLKEFPQRADEYKKILRTIDEMAILGQSPGHPGYMGYVAGAGNALSNMAQAISQTLNQFTGHYSMAPGLVTLELEALNWIQNMVSYPH